MHLLIVGASGRAAAWSARRAGLSPVAADLFADRDLSAVAACARVPAAEYPGGLVAAAEALPGGPFIYTGALENHPRVLDRLARIRPLWGNGPATVRAVRDPLAVADALRAAGIAHPEVHVGEPTGLPRDGSWLRKPLASAGGVGISPLDWADRAGDRKKPRAVYYQRRIDGTSVSGVYLGVRSGASLVGISRQLTGTTRSPFIYRGSLGPWPVSAQTQARFEAIGAVLASRFGLVGLFGVDAILDGDGQPWPVEVNPRYTASVELLELALGRSLLVEHRNACEGRPVAADRAHSVGRFVIKEVIYAEALCVLEAAVPEMKWHSDDPFRVPEVGDVPAAGTRFAPGAPIVTVFAEGPSPVACFEAIRRARAEWLRRLRSAPA
jgi:predicted ATP-grasp superfamily ATP-dependent carboligase